MHNQRQFIGLPSPFIRSRGDAYAIGGASPKLVFDPVADVYRTGGSATTFAGLVDYTGASNKTMTDSDGVLKWAPHNLALNSGNALLWASTGGSATGTGLTDPFGGAEAVEWTFTGVNQQLYNRASVVLADYTARGWVKGVAGETISLTGVGSVLLSGDWQLVTAPQAADTTPELNFNTFGGATARVIQVWGAQLYRSDLGGMADNPDTGDSYVPTTSAARYLSRRGHHVYEGGEWVNAGMLVEPTAATNLLLNSATLSTQNVTVTAQPYTLHFTGTGTVTLSGASTAGPLVGTGTGENNRVRLTFTPGAGTLTVTVSGTVTNAQLEVGSVPSSYIPTAGSTATRAAETVSIAAAKLPYSATAMSIAMRGRMTYADTNAAIEARPMSWRLDAANFIDNILVTTAGATGGVSFRQSWVGTLDTVSSASTAYSPGINVPFSIASRHGSTFINGAVDGVALTADLTPTSLPNLSATPLSLANSGGPMIIEEFAMFDTDLGDSGISEASA